MACEVLKEDAQAYLDNELSPARRAAVEDHIHKCRECQLIVSELRQVSVVLGAWSDAKASRKLQLELGLKLSTEVPSHSIIIPAAHPEALPRPEARKRPAAAAQHPGRWALTGWRPVAVAAAVLLAVAVAATLRARPGNPARPVRKTSRNVLAALSGIANPSQMADASTFANAVAKQAIAADRLDSAKVAGSDVIYAFLAAVDSQAGTSAGRKLVNLLAAGEKVTVSDVRYAGILEILSHALGTPAYAVEQFADPLADARMDERQGRLHEALIKYRAIGTGETTGRAKLAIGSLMLRLGDLEGAGKELTEAAANPDQVTRSMASALLGEVAAARDAQAELKTRRAKVVNGNDWYDVALLEVRAYDFRNAANSFMKAANAAETNQAEFAREARFRSAWCQVQAGQISTGIYGFKSIVAEGRKADEIEYAAAIEQAVGLARIGKFSESVAVCRQVVKLPAPNSGLEALAFFQKGTVELRDLKDLNAAADSLGHVSAAGRGNLSYAAQVLLSSTAR